MNVDELIADLKRAPISEPTKRMLERIFKTLDIPLVWCRFCGAPFVPKKPEQIYCPETPARKCKDDDWNGRRRSGED